MSRHAWILIGCTLFAACASAPPPAAPAPQRQGQILKASEGFWDARNRGDAAAFAAQFGDSGIFMVPGLPDATGQTAIRALAEKRFASMQITDFTVDRREIDVMGDTAHEMGWFTETNRGQGEAMRMRGRYLIVWKDAGGGVWRVARYFYNFSGAEPVA